jgi:glutathione synthase/RimK-type ligase-like ATP-grasp enzyme
MPSRAPLAIATCREFPVLLDDDQPIVAGLAAHGVVAETVLWDEPRDWTRYAGVLLRSVWDYYQRPTEFLAWLAQLEARGVRLWNPIPLVRWNADKRYLRDLEARGVRVPPTCWVEPGTSVEQALSAIRATGWDDLVVKPSVSGGAWRTLRLRRAELDGARAHLAEVLRDSALLAQPFLPEIVRDGELSLLFFGGRFSHAVRKRPKAGDYRVQWSHGGTQAALTPPPALIAEARAVFAAAPSPGLYARVDGILRDGHLLLMELEQLEPYLFLAEVPGSAERFVGALLEQLGARA